jgi:hypothetical protein
MTDHPSFESLSAFFDGEPDREGIANHAQACADCRALLRSFEAERAVIRSAWKAPAMPEDLRTALLDAIPSEGSPEPGLWEQLRRSLRGPAPAVAAAAACLALALWARGTGLFGSRVEIPADLFVAAHNQYELTLPLAPKERIMTEIPRGLAIGFVPGAERTSDVY